MDGEGTSIADQSGESTAAPIAPASAATAGERFAQVPLDQIPDPNGDWHKAFHNARQFEQVGESWVATIARMKAAGHTPESIDLELSQPGAAQPAPAYQPQQQQGGDLRGEIRSAVQEATSDLRGQFQQDQVAFFEQQQAQSRAQQDEAQASQREREAATAFLDEMKLPLKDGETPDRRHQMYTREFYSAVDEVMLAEKPDGVQPGTAEYNAYMRRPTDEQFKTAAVNASWLENLEIQKIAKLAESQQEAIPSETLGEGAGGGETKPDWDAMTPEQQDEAITPHVPND